MIESVKGYPLLAGASGTEPADVAALAKTIARLSVFAETNREVIESIEVNPLLVQPAGQGVGAVDAQSV